MSRASNELNLIICRISFFSALSSASKFSSSGAFSSWVVFKIDSDVFY